MPLAALLFLSPTLFFSCARMGNPDGGWYDETPPKVLGATPEDKAINVNSRKIKIFFDEFIKIDNPTEKVVISPPQMEMPEISGAGRKIEIELKDSLRPNTTYTVDFSDAISDNNEGNPLGNFTYSFSTGTEIDTFEVSGYVLEAENLEPIKGILVGLYDNPEDSAFTTTPFLRVSRTDGSGHFTIKGIAPGNYRVYALQDADNNYYFNQKSEKIAFNNDIITPSSRPDTRPDTIWRDTLHLERINMIPYMHFYPDDITLIAFTEKQTDRFFVKAERKEPDHFTLFFTNGSDSLPNIKGINFDANNAFVVETNETNDTITYWLRDTALINQDTLRMDISFMGTDTLGQLCMQTENTELLPKLSYEKRLKLQKKEIDEWKKEQEKQKKKGLPYDSIYPVKPLAIKLDAPSSLDPDQNIFFSSPSPLAVADTNMIHLYAKQDTLWYKTRFKFEEVGNRRYQLKAQWLPGTEYSLETDSAAFVDIYGLAAAATKKGFKVKTLDDYATILVSLQGMGNKTKVLQLLNTSDAPVKEVITNKSDAEFFYIKPGQYYLRLYIDENNNGKWDTGSFENNQQAEATYYYSEPIECKAKWDFNVSWNPTAQPRYKQKPEKITKQKPDKQKAIKKRNIERAAKLGIQYNPKN